jgi:chemotaxis protein histidine kinase CheA
VTSTEFHQQLATIRDRFAGTLDGKIADSLAALSRLSEAGEQPENGMKGIYRQIHSICGVAPTVGFERTGEAARECEGVLLGPMRAGRQLSDDEVGILRRCLEALAETARLELAGLKCRQTEADRAAATVSEASAADCIGAVMGRESEAESGRCGF